MKATSVQHNLSLYQFTHKRVEAIATELRKVDLLPRAGRGPHAPDVTCRDAAIFMIAVAGSERVADAIEVALSTAALVDSQGKSLVDVLSAAICDLHKAQGIRNVRLIVESKMAEITMRNGSVDRYFGADAWADQNFVPEAQGQGFVGRIGHIGGAVIEQLALEHAHEDETGEWLG